MTAPTETVDWSVREAEMQLLLGEEVPGARLVRLVEGDTGRPCLSGDPEDWFPVHETPELAQALCAGCQVLELCRELAMRKPEHGIWGGTTTIERQNARRRDRRAAYARNAGPVSGDGTAA